MMKHSETRIPPDKNIQYKNKKTILKIVKKQNSQEGEPYKYLDYEITEEPISRKKSKKHSKAKRKSCGCK
jgi:hypothetical protein